MNWKPLQQPERKADAGDGLSPAAHCLILALIGLAAIAVSMFVPRHEPTLSLMRASPLAPARAAPAPTAQGGGGTASAPTDPRAAEPLDYFPRQFPTPTADAAEQAPTF